MADYENMNINEVKRLAKQDNGDALFEMAWRLEAMPSGFSKNDPVYNSAWQDYWFERAADTGHIDARSRYARSLINRIFDAECRQKAVGYFDSLVRDFDTGKLKGDSELDGIISKLWLGVMLCQGLGTRRDAAEGAKLLREADTLTNGFDKFGYEALSKLAETYGQGCVQAGGEPSGDDLRQAIAYQRKAVARFNPEKNDPNNRGILGIAKKYLEALEKRKEIKESFKDSASALGFDVSGAGVNPEFTKWQEGMMALSPAAMERNNADKAALARLSEKLDIEYPNQKTKYNKLSSAKNTASTWNKFEEIAKGFRNLRGYEDSTALADECEKLAAEAKEAAYNRLLEIKSDEEAKAKHSISEFRNLAKNFREFGTGYKNVSAVANDCDRIATAQEQKNRFNILVEKMQKTSGENAFKELAKEFRSIGDYPGTSEKAKECDALASEAKETIYNQLLKSKSEEEAKTEHNISEFRSLAQKFRELGTGYKDVFAVANDCDRIATAQEQKNKFNALVEKTTKTSSENEFKELAKDFRSMGDYPNASAKADECEKRYQELKEERIQTLYSDASSDMQRLEQQKSRKPNDLRNLAKEWTQLSNRFKTIADYKDSDALANKCVQKSTAASIKADKVEKRSEKTPPIIGWLMQTGALAAFIYLLLKSDLFHSISFGSHAVRNQWGELLEANYMFSLLLLLPIFCFGLTEKLIGTITRTKCKVFLLSAIIAQTIFLGDWGRFALYDINYVPHYFIEIGIQIAASVVACVFGYLIGRIIGKQIKPQKTKTPCKKFKGETSATTIIFIGALVLGVGLFFDMVDIPLTPHDTSEYFEQIETRVTEAIPHEYVDVKNFSEGLAAVEKGNLLGGKWGFIDKNGNEVIPFIYDAVESFSNGVALVRTGNENSGEWVYIDKTGNKVGTHEEDPSTRTYINGLATVRSGGTVSLIDMYGNIIVPHGRYTQITLTAEELLVVRTGSGRDQRYGMISRYGQVVIRASYIRRPSYSEGFALVRIDNSNKASDARFVFYDTAGNDVFSTVYEGANRFSGGFASVRVDGKWGFIDTSGNAITPFMYNSVSSFSEGLAAVNLNGKWGYIDTAGNEMITPAYNSAAAFSDGRTIVSQNGMFGVIDRNGTVITPFVYDSASSFSNGVAAVKRGSVYGLIDTGGNELAAFTIDSSLYYPPHINELNTAVLIEAGTVFLGFSPIYMDDMPILQLQRLYTRGRYKYGFMNEAGEEIVPFIYDNPIVISEGMAAVRYNGKWGFISLSANISSIFPETDETDWGDMYEYN